MIAVMLGAVHGTVMPMAFFFLSDLYHAIYMPNDDGSLPPVNSPHSVRDTKVAEVGMTYILLALVVLCARTGGCYMAIHAADRQVVAARRQYFHQILMQGPSWHDLHQANELAPPVGTGHPSLPGWHWRTLGGFLASCCHGVVCLSALKRMEDTETLFQALTNLYVSTKISTCLNL